MSYFFYFFKIFYPHLYPVPGVTLLDWSLSSPPKFSSLNARKIEKKKK